MADLRDLWEETSFQLERRQCNADCVEEERLGLRHRRAPAFDLTFDPAPCYEAGSSDVPGETTHQLLKLVVVVVVCFSFHYLRF